MIKLTINKDTYNIELFRDVEANVLNAIRYWNNFGDKMSLTLILHKEEDSHALQVKVAENINTQDLFG